MSEDAARQEAERAAEAESSRRTQEWYGKDGEAFGQYEFTARTYEEGFEDGAEWQAAQPVVVTAEQREAFARVIFDADYAQGELVGDAPEHYADYRTEYLWRADVAYGHLGITVTEETL